jgi:hypothetical protein
VAALGALTACGPEDPSAPPVERSARGLVRANGEILIVDGELNFNVDSQGGVIGTGAGERQALMSQVANELANNENLVDSLDAVVVFTTFDDAGNSADSTSLLLFNEVEGIGLPTPTSEPDPVEDLREDYGLQPGTPLHRRMRNLVYFNQPTLFVEDGGSLDDLNEVEGDFHALVARRLATRWLFNASFAEGTNISDELQGSVAPGDIGANWSNLADASGSVVGGYDFRDDGGGSFTNLGTNLGFAPLDLYLMGFVGPQNVPDLFLIRDASQMGNPLGPDAEIAEGATISGERVDVSIAQIIEAMGPRVPASFDFVPYQRVAFVLLTLPGQASQDYAEEVAFLQELQRSFPDSWKAWTGVSICTRVTGTCPEPSLIVDDFSISDDNDNLIAPGETVQLDLEIRNVGLGLASGARVRFAVEQSPDLQVSPSSVDLPDIAQDEEITLPQPVNLTVTATNCGEPITLRTILELAEGPQTGQRLSIPIGTEGVRFDPLDEAPDWTVNPDGTDTAGDGVWALGVPELIQAPAGIFTQPSADHSLGDSELAFMTQPRSDGLFARSDVDGGRTTLESPVFAMGDTRDPLVRVWVWRTAYDFSERDPVPLDNPLVIEVSNDGGESWTVVREFTEQTQEWTAVDIRLRTPEIDIRPTNRMRFRFSIEDDTPNGVGNIEAGVDDLEIIDFLEGCPGLIPPEEPTGDGGGDDDDGGGCRSTRVEAPSLLLGLLAGLFFVRRRRRHA